MADLSVIDGARGHVARRCAEIGIQPGGSTIAEFLKSRRLPPYESLSLEQLRELYSALKTYNAIDLSTPLTYCECECERLGIHPHGIEVALLLRLEGYPKYGDCELLELSWLYEQLKTFKPGGFWLYPQEGETRPREWRDIPGECKKMALWGRTPGGRNG